MLPFEDIPDDTVPVTAYLKELLQLATDKRPLLIFLDSVDELTGSQDANKMSWLPLRIPLHCKVIHIFLETSCPHLTGSDCGLVHLRGREARPHAGPQFPETDDRGRQPVP